MLETTSRISSYHHRHPSLQSTMHPSRSIQKVQPLIRFLGKRIAPKSIDHTPHVHPLSGMKELPKSFFSSTSAASAPAESGNRVSSLLDLPSKYQTPSIDLAELEQVNSGAAEIVY